MPNRPTAHPFPQLSSWHLYRAWWLLMGAPNIGPATAHKILHHKRPKLVPLLDNLTLSRLHQGNAWLHIFDDLKEFEVEFEDLERWFSDVWLANSGTPLFRLRIHDILLWCRATGQDEFALQEGRTVLLGVDPGEVP